MATKIKRLVVGTLAAVLLAGGAANALAPHTAAYWVQHETDNWPGANAAMHSTWQNSGTPGRRDGRIGVHFYVDDREIIQMIPVNEQGVHSGDRRG